MAVTPIVAGTIDEFISYALVITSIMIVYYIIKFFLVGSLHPENKAERDRDLAARRQKVDETLTDWGKKREAKETAAKTEKERKLREDLMRPAKENLVHAVQAADDLISSMRTATTEQDRDHLIDLVKKCHKEIEKARRNLRNERHHMKTEEHRNHLRDRINEIEAIEDHIKDRIIDAIPKKMSSAFLSQLKSANVPAETKSLRGMMHNLWNELAKFHQ